MWYSSSSGKIELQITKAQAASCSHQGDCYADVEILRKNPKIARQLREIDPLELIQELKEFGAWEDEELQDHEINLNRILWSACCDIDEDVNS